VALPLPAGVKRKEPQSDPRRNKTVNDWLTAQLAVETNHFVDVKPFLT